VCVLLVCISLHLYVYTLLLAVCLLLQDNSYWEPRIWGEQVLTVWVALVDATVENGCMQLVQGGHSSGKTARHTIGTTTSTWYTELSEADLQAELLGGAPLCDDRLVTVEAPAGSIIIFGASFGQTCDCRPQCFPPPHPLPPHTLSRPPTHARAHMHIWRCCEYSLTL